MKVLFTWENSICFNPLTRLLRTANVVFNDRGNELDVTREA